MLFIYLQIIVLDEGVSDMDSLEADQFWKILGTTDNKPTARENTTSTTMDKQSEQYQQQEDQLSRELDSHIIVYQIHADSKSRYRRLTQVHPTTNNTNNNNNNNKDATRPSKDILKRRYCYILDVGSELFVWIGRKSSLSSRKLAMKVSKSIHSSNHTVSEKRDNTIILLFFILGCHQTVDDEEE